MLSFPDLTITALDTITAFNITSGDYLFTLDELQNASIAQSEEKTDITGKRGRKLSSLKRNKAVTVSATNGMISGGLLALQSGSDFEKKATTVMWADYISANNNGAVISYKAVGTAGAEITLYTKNENGTLGTKLTQVGENPGAGEFTYDSNRTITFVTNEFTDGAEFVAYYEREIYADTLENYSDKYSGKATLYIDATAEDKCANVYHVQFYFPKVDISGEWTIDMGDNQTVHNFEAEALSGACGAGAIFFTFTVFSEDATDYNTRTLESIAVTTQPTKVAYSAGESFATAGMVVTATYDNGETATVSNYSVVPAGALATTDKSVTISYTENYVTKTTTQAITVS